MGNLITQAVVWPALLASLLMFGFAPGAVLRIIVLAFRRDDPRRTELLGELSNVPRIERPFWVCEQLEIALFEGLASRLTSLTKKIRHSRDRSAQELNREVWAALGPMPVLLAPGLRCTDVQVTFRSPVFFSHNGCSHLVPDPRMIVGSWRRKWNESVREEESARLPIPGDVWREVGLAVELTEYDLRTEYRDNGYGRNQAGFAGTVTLRLDKAASADARRAFAAVAQFAESCGTGALTAQGFGATSVTLLPDLD